MIKVWKPVVLKKTFVRHSSIHDERGVTRAIMMKSTVAIDWVMMSRFSALRALIGGGQKNGFGRFTVMKRAKTRYVRSLSAQEHGENQE